MPANDQELRADFHQSRGRSCDTQFLSEKVAKRLIEQLALRDLGQALSLYDHHPSFAGSLGGGPNAPDRARLGPPGSDLLLQPFGLPYFQHGRLALSSS